MSSIIFLHNFITLYSFLGNPPPCFTCKGCTYSTTTDSLEAAVFVGGISSKFKTFQTALEIFHELNGHLLVPRGFVVPASEKWPKSVWGYPLGLRVNSVRKGESYSTIAEKEKLNAMGFVWEVNDFKFYQLCEVLKIYLKLYGTLEVPYDFTLTHNTSHKISLEDWPYWANGLKLGQRVRCIRSGQLYSKESHLRKFQELELYLHLFPTIPKINSTYDIFEIFLAFHNLHGHLRIPKSLFIKRNDERWPQKFHEHDVGKLIYHFRAKNANHFGNESINSLISAAKISTGAELKFEIVFLGLSEYKNRFGTLYVPANFIIPTHTEALSSDSKPGSDVGLEPWPSILCGMRLGDQVRILRRNKKFRQDEDYSKKLEEIGFIWNLTEHKRQTVSDQLRIYHSLHHTTNVPYDYVIPRHSSWPKGYWGVALGSQLRRVSAVEPVGGASQTTNTLPTRRSRDERFETVIKALSVHKELYGDFYVPRTFRVPEDDCWPEEVRGIHLGTRVRNIRFGTSFKQSRYRDRLREMGFPLDEHGHGWTRVRSE